MIKKLFAICVFLCADLILFVVIYNSTAGREEPLKVSTTFYENVIAITFDDGPHQVYTKELLDGLASRDVKATFFVVGERIEGNEDLIERMEQEGHLIGNHTYSHVQLSAVNQDNACFEINKTNELIENITGNKVKYIRPPYGSYDAELECAVDMTEVGWSIDPVDWNTTDVESIVKQVVSKASDGDIILMHDIYSSSVSAALKIIDELKNKGFIFVTVDEILIE